jgi:hypothetical protein
MTLASEWLCSFALVCLAAWQHGGIAACPARALRQTTPEKPSALQPAVHGVRAGGLGWPRRGSLAWPAACVLSSVALGGDDATGPLGPREMEGRDDIGTTLRRTPSESYSDPPFSADWPCQTIHLT